MSDLRITFPKRRHCSTHTDCLYYNIKQTVYAFLTLFLHLAKGSQTAQRSHIKFASVVALVFLRSVSIFLTSMFYPSRVMSILTFESKRNNKQWLLTLRQAKFRFLEVA